MHQGIPHNSPIQFNQLGVRPPDASWFSQGVPGNINPGIPPGRMAPYPWRGDWRQSPRNAGIPIQDPTTMFPVNQLPNADTTGFPTRYNMPIPGNAPFYNPVNPEGSMFPVNQLPNRSHFSGVMPGPIGPMMEGNNPPIPAPAPTPTQVGFAAYMRSIGKPLPNDPVANAPLGLGLGFR